MNETALTLSDSCRSNDPHVIALAQINGARLLYSNDEALQKDFGDKRLEEECIRHAGIGSFRMSTGGSCRIENFVAPEHDDVFLIISVSAAMWNPVVLAVDGKLAFCRGPVALFPTVSSPSRHRSCSLSVWLGRPGC